MGGWVVQLTRRTYEARKDGRWLVTIETSDDLGTTWSVRETRRYTRRTEGALGTVFPVRGDDGAPAADRPEGADAFDFLVGDFDATHWRVQPDGSEIRWRSRSTAVHALDGHGILEFDWFDADPSLPDAATSLLRLYNHAERRWESLFLTNRAQSVLFFGGATEGDEIVLHFVDAGVDGPVSRWIFYDVRPDSYRWKGLISNDRGTTFQPTWTIELTRRGASVEDTAGGDSG